METKRVVVGVYVFVGAKTLEAWEVPSSMSSTDLDMFAYERGVQYAESYGVYNPGDGADWDDQDAYDEELYNWERVDYWWEHYGAEKHDGRLKYGFNREITWNKYWKSKVAIVTVI